LPLGAVLNLESLTCGIASFFGQRIEEKPMDKLRVPVGLQ